MDNKLGLKTVELASELITNISLAEMYGYTPTISTNVMDKVCELGSILEEYAITIPKPSKNIMVKKALEWYHNSTLTDQYEFNTTEFNKLSVFHSTIGENIRNYFNLWAYYKEGEEWHPDEASMEVIEEIWRITKDE